MDMTPQVLLEKMRTLLEQAPELAGRGHYGNEHYRWLGHAIALVIAWNPSESISFKVAAGCIGGAHDRSGYTSQILSTLHRAVFELEEIVRASPQQAFGPGAVYDFFKALNEIVASANQKLMIVDPYIDNTIFDAYLGSLQSGVHVKLLINKYSASLKPALAKFTAQFGRTVEARESSALHDRLVLVDDKECWVIGASIKDAAAKKPTYMAPLEPQVALLKQDFYETIWRTSVAI